jgi:hypothetical protein
MNTKDLTIGAAITAVSLAALMFCLWALNLVSEADIIRFENTEHRILFWNISNALVMVLTAIGVVLAGGWFWASFRAGRAVAPVIAISESL